MRCLCGGGSGRRRMLGVSWSAGVYRSGAIGTGVYGMGEGLPAGRRRRPRQATRRVCAVKPTFTPDEYELLATAAGRAGLSVGAYLATVGVRVARGEVVPLPADWREVLVDLAEDRTQIQRVGVLLNQLVRVAHQSGQIPAGLVDVLGRLARLLAEPLALRPPPPGGPVWHCSLRAALTDRKLTDAEWAAAAQTVLDRVGIAPAGDDRACRWVAVRHADDHIHIAAVLARQDGQRVRVWRDYLRARQACRAIEDRFGLRATAPADRTATPSPTRTEAEQAARTGRKPTPATLRRAVRRAAASTTNPQEFVDQLRAAGLRVRERRSPRTRELTGYAVATTDPDSFWYPGGRLAPDLSLPQLRTRWAGLSTTTPSTRPAPQTAAQHAATVLTSPGHSAVTAAIRAAGDAADHIRADTGETPGIAHATGDLLTAAAAAIEGHHGGPFTTAADRYDAAARTPHIATPRTGPTATRLRLTARALAALGPHPHRSDAVKLTAALADLVVVIARWRADNHHRAQADAAVDTARTLRTASLPAPTSLPGPAPTATRHQPHQRPGRGQPPRR